MPHVQHPNKPDKDTWPQDEGSPQYFNIVNKLPELVSVRHELTKTQYAYSDKVGMTSYDDEEVSRHKSQSIRFVYPVISFTQTHTLFCRQFATRRSIVWTGI